MKDLRIKVATALIASVLSLLGAANAARAAEPATEVRYACIPAQRFVVTKSESTAVVQFVDRAYELRRKPSSIGQKYISNRAALIIDGPSAVFVAEDRLQLGTCLEATVMVAR